MIRFEFWPPNLWMWQIKLHKTSYKDSIFQDWDWKITLPCGTIYKQLTGEQLEYKMWAHQGFKQRWN